MQTVAALTGRKEPVQECLHKYKQEGHLSPSIEGTVVSLIPAASKQTWGSMVDLACRCIGSMIGSFSQWRQLEDLSSMVMFSNRALVHTSNRLVWFM